MVNPETLQNHIKNVHHKNGQSKPVKSSTETIPIAEPTGQETSEKQPEITGLSGGPGPLPSSSAIAGLDSRYSLLNYPFFHPGPC